MYKVGHINQQNQVRIARNLILIQEGTDYLITVERLRIIKNKDYL